MIGLILRLDSRKVPTEGEDRRKANLGHNFEVNDEVQMKNLLFISMILSMLSCDNANKSDIIHSCSSQKQDLVDGHRVYCELNSALIPQKTMDVASVTVADPNYKILTADEINLIASAKNGEGSATDGCPERISKYRVGWNTDADRYGCISRSTK